jgi:LysR family tcuABC transcriptional regulator
MDFSSNILSLQGLTLVFVLSAQSLFSDRLCHIFFLAMLGVHVDLRQLKYFVQIVDSGSLAKASRELHIAQPALSQHIAKLEAEVGKTLLIRTSKGVTPTESGAALHHHARFILRQLENALSIARQETGAIQGAVTLGLAATTVCAVGAPLMRNIRKKYPGIVLNIVEGMSGHLAQMMRGNQLDLAILFGRDLVSDCEYENILEEELFVLAPDENPFIDLSVQSLTMEQVAMLPLIMPTSMHGLRKRVINIFEQNKFEIKISAEIDSLSLLMHCVKEGMGLTIKPMSAMLLDGTMRSNWRALKVNDVSLKRDNYLYSFNNEKMTPAVLAVKNELKNTIKNLFDENKWQGIEIFY